MQFSQDLTSYPNFCTWLYGDKRANGKPSKIPFSVKNGKALNGHVSLADLSSFQDAIQAAQARKHTGIGLHLGDGITRESDGALLFALDFDGLSSNPQAAGWYERLKQLTYTENTPSGGGGRAFLWGNAGHIRKNARALGIEIYTHGGFVTVTGKATGQPTVTPLDTELSELLTLLNSHTETTPKTQPETPQGGGARLTDDEVLAVAFRAKNGTETRRIFEGEAHDGGDTSESGILYAILRRLTFYCDSPDQLMRIAKQSAHYSEKWERSAGGGLSLLEKSARKAFSEQTNFYTKPKTRKTKNEQTQNAMRSFHCTDLGNAERFCANNGDKARYVHPWKSWLVWNGIHWLKDEAGTAERLAKTTVRDIYIEAAKTDADGARKELADHAKKSESAKAIAAMLSLARSEPGIPVLPDDLDKNLYQLNVKNGIVDMLTGQLLPHDKTAYHTKHVPIEYQAGAQCPAWIAFLNKIMGNDGELISYLQRSIGYSLTGDTGEQCLFFLYGHGKNGKSTFIETLTALLGDYGLKTPTSTLMAKKTGGGGIPNDVARLHGARLVTASEVDEGNRLNESLVKDLTGGDTISARFLHSEFFNFKPIFKLWMFGNHKPVIRGTDKGIWRRIRLIPFEVTISDHEADRNLPEKLRAELPGILAWAIQGCLDWRRVGLKPPLRITQATAEYQAEMDIVGSFISECCTTGDAEKCSAKDLYKAYTDWSKEGGEFVANQRRFGQGLTERGFERVRRGDGFWWYGISLNIDINTGGGFGAHLEVEI